jgi:hypothetical protein
VKTTDTQANLLSTISNAAGFDNFGDTAPGTTNCRAAEVTLDHPPLVGWQVGLT